MDGENFHGKAYEQMDTNGGVPFFFEQNRPANTKLMALLTNYPIKTAPGVE